MIQKIIKVGNSYAVTIPKDIVNEAKLEVGQKVQVAIQPVTGEAVETQITPEFYLWLKQFNKKYKAVLTELAKK